MIFNLQRTPSHLDGTDLKVFHKLTFRTFDFAIVSELNDAGRKISPAGATHNLFIFEILSDFLRHSNQDSTLHNRRANRLRSSSLMTFIQRDLADATLLPIELLRLWASSLWVFR